HATETALAEESDHAIAPDGFPVLQRRFLGRVAIRNIGTAPRGRRTPSREKSTLICQLIRRQESLNLGPELGVAGTRTIEDFRAVGGRQRGRLVEDGLDCPPTLRRHSDTPPSRLPSQARAMRKSPFTVPGETSRTSAISAKVMSAKMWRVTIWACRSSCSAN